MACHAVAGNRDDEAQSACEQHVDPCESNLRLISRQTLNLHLCIENYIDFGTGQPPARLTPMLANLSSLKILDWLLLCVFPT